MWAKAGGSRASSWEAVIEPFGRQQPLSWLGLCFLPTAVTSNCGGALLYASRLLSRLLQTHGSGVWIQHYWRGRWALPLMLEIVHPCLPADALRAIAARFGLSWSYVSFQHNQHGHCPAADAFVTTATHLPPDAHCRGICMVQSCACC